MKYYSKAKIDKVLLENATIRIGRPLPEPNYRKLFLESVSTSITLTEGVKEALGSLIDEVMFFFKNPAANNLRVSDLMLLEKKTAALGGLTEEAPALKKALALIGKEVQSGDRLKVLIKYWFKYILQDYKEISPIVAFNKELNSLEKALVNSKSIKALQGDSSYVDQALGNDGIIPVFKKISEKLLSSADSLKASEDVPDDELLKSVIEHDRFKPNLSKNLSNKDDVTGMYNFYQERGLPASKLHEAVLFEAIIKTLAKY
jgi:hypothetical protein